MFDPDWEEEEEGIPHNLKEGDVEKARENALGVDYELHDLISKNGPRWGEIGKIASLCSVGSCRPPFWAQIASFGSVRTKRRVRQPVRHRKSGSRRVKKNGHPERGPRVRAQRTAPVNEGTG